MSDGAAHQDERARSMRPSWRRPRLLVERGLWRRCL